MLILKDMAALTQYLQFIKQCSSTCFSHLCCPHCGYAILWRHGGYGRKADRENPAEQSLNLIYIQRLLCVACKKTCSVLPECIPPRRWYLWDVQQMALVLLMAGNSAAAVAKEILPSRHTIQRWVTRFKEQLHHHKDSLCNHFNELGRTNNFTDFWHACLKQISLAQAMRLCHVAGVAIP